MIYGKIYKHKQVQVIEHIFTFPSEVLLELIIFHQPSKSNLNFTALWIRCARKQMALPGLYD